MQSIAQPTWLEMHSVPRPGSGMKTVSMPCVPSIASSHLRVPSAETCVVVIEGVATTATSFRRSRKLFARSVIWSKSATQRLYSHFSSWRARNGFSPIPAMNASSSARVSPSRFVFAGRSGVAFIAATILQS